MFSSTIRIVSCQWRRNLTQNLTQMRPKRRSKVSDIQKMDHLLINKLLLSHNQITADQWMSIRKELCQDKELDSISEANVDSIIYDLCGNMSAETKLDYFQFLKTQNIKLNIALIAKYFKTIHDHKDKLNEKIQADICRLYDQIRTDYPILDNQTIERCIEALSLTNRWKEISELIKMLEDTQNCRSPMYSIMVSAAFDHDNADLGWTYLDKMGPEMMPLDCAYQSYVNYSLRHSKSLNMLENSFLRIFQTWQESEIVPYKNTVDLFIKPLKDSGQWTANNVFIASNGKCKNCEGFLVEAKFSEEEFNFLAETIINQVLVGNDVYRKTTPKELLRFKEFIELSKPYDIVIDGLNASYVLSAGANINSPAISLEKVVRKFVEKGKKVMVLGRKHMNNWSKSNMNYIKNHSKLFLADNLSSDDPFMLYAALSGGSNTFIVTKDFLRQHKFILSDTKTKQIFIRWQMSRQIVPCPVKANGQWNVGLLYPKKFLLAAQQNGNNWHIPYRLEEDNKEIQILGAPDTWICLQKRHDECKT